MSAIRVLLADDHQIVRDGIMALFEDVTDIEIIGGAHNGKRAIEIVELMQPDVVLMDVDMPEMNGIEAARVVLAQFPGTKVVMLTMHNESSFARKVREMGVHGYLVKTTDKEEMVAAIRQVSQGHVYFSKEVISTPSAEEKADTLILAELTEREVEILKLIAEGYSNKEIGEKLFISHRTVDTHRTNLARKIGAKNIAALIRFAIKNGLIQQD